MQEFLLLFIKLKTGNMKKLIYVIVVPIILIFAYLGGYYWFDIGFILLRAFHWNGGDLLPNFRSISGTIIFVMSDLALLYYLLYMRHKQKKEHIKFSMLQKILLTIALTLFVEITINGIFLTALLWGGYMGLFLVTYGFSYPFTIGLTICITFSWILKNKFDGKKCNELAN